MFRKKNQQKKLRSDRSEIVPTDSSRPQKVMLHVARQDGSWRGKAVSFDRNEEFLFRSLSELAAWLERNTITKQ